MGHFFHHGGHHGRRSECRTPRFFSDLRGSCVEHHPLIYELGMDLFTDHACCGGHWGRAQPSYSAIARAEFPATVGNWARCVLRVYDWGEAPLCAFRLEWIPERCGV